MTLLSPPAANGQFIPFDFATGTTYALGLTYADHIRETGEKPGQPVVFRKQCAPSPIERALIPTPSAQALSDMLQALDPTLATWLAQQFGPLPALFDYEVELGMVLLEDVSELALKQGAALPRIGFFLANDLTVRSVQIAGEGAANPLDFWSAAKSVAGFLPVGTRVWCPDGVGEDALPELVLETVVNGVPRQLASTRSLIYSLRQMLQFAAAAAPDGRLRQHDLILTGTPAGVALSVPRWKRWLGRLLPRRQRIRAALRSSLSNSRFLQAGDQVEVRAGWLGSFYITVA